jgi:RNA polymerase sigma-70 factor (ECF subfamily)
VDARSRFEALYRAHAGVVRTYVRRRSDVEGADDLVAEVFLVAWRRLGDVPEDPLPWLLGVARRVLANRRRGASRDAALLDRITFEPASPASDESGGLESARAIARALSALRESDREALLLVAWEGLSPGQAARVLGVRPNTFAARLSRARRRFAQALAAEGGQSAQQNSPVRTEAVP